jgi:uncharacterized protein (TIGR02246 family)
MGVKERPSMSEDESAIRELVATWMAASKAGDLDTVLSLMADDVIFMVPGREPFGKEEFAAASRSMTTSASKAQATSRRSRCLATGLICTIASPSP